MQPRRSETTQFYEDFSYDDVWSASFKTLKGMGFVVTREEKKNGVIVAGKRGLVEAASLPYLIIHLRNYTVRIAVDCRVIVKGSSYKLNFDSKWKIREYRRAFFDNLNKNLGI
jgi:hypothetical protein